jgi:Zn-dependent protease
MDHRMFGGGSLQLARVFGIRIGVHTSWFIVVFLTIVVLEPSFADILGNDNQGFAAAAISVILFFGSILLHELGHAFAARREGIGVDGIDLFFFGGVMHMSRDTTTPGQEFRVAAAGPFVTFLVCLVAGALAIGIDGWTGVRDLVQLNGSAGMGGLVVAFVLVMNVFLLGFNLIPAFPLDGGRIARAIAWRVTGQRDKGTRFAALMGQGFAILLMGYGAYLVIFESDFFGGLWSFFLGWMIGGAARTAVAQSAVTSKLEGITVADVMDAEPVTIPADLPAGRAYEEFFLRYQGWPWFAIVEADGRFAGLAQRDAVESAPPDLPVRAVASMGDEIGADDPIEALLGSEPLRRRGALMAVDADGTLRGVVTMEMVARVLQTRLAPTP